jgi:hypothetical protein
VQENEWQKEACVLWRYCDRLAALVDLMVAGGVPKPPKPPPSIRPHGSKYVAPLATIISAATSSSRQTSPSLGCPSNDEDPGRMDASRLKRTLRAVAAVESYLANSGRLELVASESNSDPQASERVAHEDLSTSLATNRTGVLLPMLASPVNLPRYSLESVQSR